MKFRTKLSVSFLFVAFVIAAIGVPVFMNSRNIGDSFNRLDKESVPQIISLQRMQTDSITVYSRALEYTVEDDEQELLDYRDEIIVAEHDFDKEYQSFESPGSTSDVLYDRQSIDSIKQDWVDFVLKAENVLTVVDSKSDEEAIADARESMEKAQEKFSSTVDSTLKQEQEQNQVLRTAVEDALRSSLLLIILGFAAAAVFAVTLGNFIARRISAPIINVRNALDDLVHGRYDTQIPKAPADEVGDLVAHFHSVRQQLREKERLQKEFLMIASHELRTPIQPILGYAELARKGVINLDKALDIITEEARRLKRLADDILDASSLEADRMNYYMDDINAAGFIREIADAAKISNTNKNAAVSIDTEINIPESSIIYGDRQRLSQAIWNIINNALRFTSEGSVTLSCQAIEGNNDNYVEIKIVDTGAGIPESVLPNLFRKFASKDVDGKSKHGTGLGLFISKGIIEAHHGKISTSRNKDRGTTFTITLALKSSPNSAIRVQSAS